MTPDRWQRIQELYLAALQLELAPRAAFLAEACAGDEVLQHEVASLLAAHDEAGTLPQRRRTRRGFVASVARRVWRGSRSPAR